MARRSYSRRSTGRRTGYRRVQRNSYGRRRSGSRASSASRARRYSGREVRIVVEQRAATPVMPVGVTDAGPPPRARF